uniref:Uncharacterized protein n=1 Tax=viral metagenome TaxID=1070528 RepID=A0A6M3JXA9_9ZZZZ
MKKVIVILDEKGNSVCPQCYNTGQYSSGDDSFLGRAGCERCYFRHPNSKKYKELRKLREELGIILSKIDNLENK